jgi:ubiquinone/menaquinone biosynthesis C-methylase UbiE
MAGHGINHPIFARCYARMSVTMEHEIGAHRRQLLAGLTGRVIEVGCGNGMNFTHYPPEVTDLLAIEPEPYLRRLAERQAEHATIPVRVIDGLADQLPAPDAAFDAAVTSLVLCSVPDQARALREIRRVLRGGGQLRFLEHVRADSPRLARVQRLLDATVWPIFGGGDHSSRDTRAAIQDAGFTITSIESFRYPESRIPYPTSPHIIGRAVQPARDQPE